MLPLGNGGGLLEGESTSDGSGLFVSEVEGEVCGELASGLVGGYAGFHPISSSVVWPHSRYPILSTHTALHLP